MPSKPGSELKNTHIIVSNRKKKKKWFAATVVKKVPTGLRLRTVGLQVASVR